MSGEDAPRLNESKGDQARRTRHAHAPQPDKGSEGHTTALKTAGA